MSVDKHGFRSSTTADSVCPQAEEGEDPEVPMGKYMHDMVSAEYKMLEAMVYARDTVSEEDAKRFSQPWKQ